MEFFLLFSWIFAVVLVALAQRSGKPSSHRHSTIVPTSEDPNKIVYDFSHQPNPREYYLSMERELLEAIKAECSKKKAGCSYSKWRDMMRRKRAIEKELSNLHSQYTLFINFPDDKQPESIYGEFCRKRDSIASMT